MLNNIMDKNIDLFSPSQKVVVICFNEKPLTMVKNTFYFTLKALFGLEIFTLTLYTDFVVMLTSQPGQQIIIIHILYDIQRSKDNQTKKFGQTLL